MLIEKEYNMKTTLIALATVTALAAPVAAEDFDNTAVSISAEMGRFSLEVEGDSNGYVSTTVGAEVLSYGLGTNVDSTLDVFAKHYEAVDDFAVGAAYTVTYAPNALSVYGSAEVEYDFASEDAFVTPTVGAAYVVAEGVNAWGEVGYTWNASNDWAREGGVAEVGVDFAVASNIVLTPSVVYNFDQVGGAADEAQLNLGVGLKF